MSLLRTPGGINGRERSQRTNAAENLMKHVYAQRFRSSPWIVACSSQTGNSSDVSPNGFPRMRRAAHKGPTINDRGHKYSTRVQSRLKVIYWNVDIRSRVRSLRARGKAARPLSTLPPPPVLPSEAAQVSTSHRDADRKPMKGLLTASIGPPPAGGSCFKRSPPLTFCYGSPSLLHLAINLWRCKCSSWAPFAADENFHGACSWQILEWNYSSPLKQSSG